MAKNPEITALLVFFQLKPGYEEDFLQFKVLDDMSEEQCFLNYYLLQNTDDPYQFVVFENWACSQEHFFDVEMLRPYRQDYEETLPQMLEQPREVQKNWKVISCDCLGKNEKDLSGLFVYFHTREGKEQEFVENVSGVLENLRKDSSLVDYFLLQNQENPSEFCIFETCRDTPEDFLKTLEKPQYQHYEQLVPFLLDRPRKREVNWKLIKSESKKKLKIQSKQGS